MKIFNLSFLTFFRLAKNVGKNILWQINFWLMGLLELLAHHFLRRKKNGKLHKSKPEARSAPILICQKLKKGGKIFPIGFALWSFSKS